jgi:hypothetical protein
VVRTFGARFRWPPVHSDVRHYMDKLPPAQLLFEVDDIIRSMPPAQRLGDDSSEVLAWLGRASAAMHAWDAPKGIAYFDTYVRNLRSSVTREFAPAARVFSCCCIKHSTICE